MSPPQALAFPLPTHKGRLFQQCLKAPLSPFATLPLPLFAPQLYAPGYATGYDVLVVRFSKQSQMQVKQPKLEAVKVEQTLVKQTEVNEKAASEYADLSSWVHMWR